MNTTTTRSGTLSLAAALIAGLMAAVAVPGALAGERSDLAGHVTYSGGVDFQPYVDFASATLVLSGNGQDYQWSFESGDQLSIGTFDTAGQPLADGPYDWQLQLVPDQATARELRIAASLNDGNAPNAWHPLTGSFVIRDGQIADAELAEPGQLTRPGPRPGLRSAMTPSALGASRERAEDDDAAVGSDTEAETRVSAAASRRAAPAPAAAVLSQPDRVADDSDALAAALGEAFERSTTSDQQLSARSRGALVPQPRSDGSNGRPRS